MIKPQLVVVARGYDEHVRWTCEAARARGIEVEHVNGTAEEVEARLAELHDTIILWRSSRLTSAERLRVLTAAEQRGCTIINQALVREPMVRSKRFQQARVASESDIQGIPTVEAAGVPGLRFPVIAKPPIGSQGNGILLLQTLEDFQKLSAEEASQYIYQSFIPNTGDYRVIVVGGVPLGAMKRVGKPGEYRNNISQGGHGEDVEDPAVRSAVIDLATRVATVFGLQMCGVDIMQHAETGEWFFLEVNTVPEWNGEGFQKVTGINVAEKIIDYVETLLMRDRMSAAEMVSHWYESNMQFMPPGIPFHWWSRTYLWSRSHRSRQEIDALRSHVFGRNHSLEEHLRRVLVPDRKAGRNFPKDRKAALAKYPDILAVQSVLAKTLFAQTIYSEDIRSTALQVIGEERLRALWDGLLHDQQSLILLNTFAVNTLSFVTALFADRGFVLDPQAYVRAMEAGLAKPEVYRPRDLMYLATHAVIGASQFYDRPITEHREVYIKLLKMAEELLRKHGAEILFDAQIEFVVAHKLLGTSTDLEEGIMATVAHSRSPHEVFVTDFGRQQGANLFKSEHRNVLFVMASTPWARANISP